jgi:hypothetical protein
MAGPIKAERIVKDTLTTPLWLRRRCGLVAALVVVPLAALLAASSARAQVEARAQTDLSVRPEGEPPPDISLVLDPTAPQAGALPGGLTPAYGQRSFNEGEWRFDFHGILIAPLNIGTNSRKDTRPGQSSTVLHSPPVVPDDLETFSHTGVVPMTYAQLNFSEGNSIISANVSILAKQANTSTGFLEPASQLGINDVFLAITPQLHPRVRTDVFIGAFTSRYGTSGEYDEGRYGTPLIARINGMGERMSVKLSLGKFLFLAEQGLHGQTTTSSASTTPDVWNDFADPNAGATFVSHGHLGVGYGRYATLGLHFIRAWTQDDRGVGTLAPEASLDIYAADARLTMGRFGHLYLAYAYDNAKYVGTLSRVISVLNTRGGQGLIDQYLGGNGNGTIHTVGGQYDLSIGRLVSYPSAFSGDGPDLFVSLFGMMVKTYSEDAYHRRTMTKFGLEATYSLLSWLAVSTRYDRVDPDADYRSYSFAVLSPRVIFRTDWLATNQVVLQYSHWFDGGNTTVRVGDPPVADPTVVPDSNMVSLSANMWW